MEEGNWLGGAPAMYGHTTVVNQSNRMQGNVDGLVEDALDEAKEQREDEKIDAFRQQYEEKYGKEGFDWSRVMSSIMLGGLLGGSHSLYVLILQPQTYVN